MQRGFEARNASDQFYDEPLVVAVRNDLSSHRPPSSVTLTRQLPTRQSPLESPSAEIRIAIARPQPRTSV
jgi:hypothetical protein